MTQSVSGVSGAVAATRVVSLDSYAQQRGAEDTEDAEQGSCGLSATPSLLNHLQISDQLPFFSSLILFWHNFVAVLLL